MSLLKKLMEIDNRILYLLMFVAIIVPMLKPIGLPIPISQYTAEVYNKIEDLDSGSYVIYSMELGISSWPWAGEHFVLTLEHLLSRNLKVICVSFSASGPYLLEKVIQNLKTTEKVYGVDYVNLGFVSGGEAGMSSFARDANTLFTTDFGGTPIEELSILESFTGANDVSLFLGFTGGTPGADEYIRQFQAPYEIPVAIGWCSSGTIPSIAPYIESRQILGAVVDMKGCAEYELLRGKPGPFIAGMDSQSLVYVLVLSVLILGNIGFFAEKRSEKNV